MISRTLKFNGDFIYIISDDRCMGASMEDANTLLPPISPSKTKMVDQKFQASRKINHIELEHFFLVFCISLFLSS